MNATGLPSPAHDPNTTRSPSEAGLTLDDLRSIDVPALWAGLSPETQAAIGEAMIAERLANLASRTSTSSVADQVEAERLNFEAHTAALDAVERALPTIPWKSR